MAEISSTESCPPIAENEPKFPNIDLIKQALEEDDLSNSTMNLSLKKILKDLPRSALDRECLLDRRAYLDGRTVRAEAIARFTGNSRDIRRIAVLKAKIAAIDIMLSSDIKKLIAAQDHPFNE